MMVAALGFGLSQPDCRSTQHAPDKVSRPEVRGDCQSGCDVPLGVHGRVHHIASIRQEDVDAILFSDPGEDSSDFMWNTSSKI